MRNKLDIMKILHKVREEHYHKTRKMKPEKIKEELKKETQGIIKKTGLVYSKKYGIEK